MNTIKFSKIQNKTTEQHNLELSEVQTQDVFRQKLQIYTPCNVNIFVTEICQNNCAFCINRKTNENVNMRYLTDDEYINGLHILFDELDCKNYEATITGGEPTLDTFKFIKTIQLCKQYGVKCRTVSTTGINLMQTFNKKPICQYMIENGFIHNINISRMHYDELKNAEIFNGKNISNDDIKRLALFFKMNDAEMRISCNLIKGYIDDAEKMINFVNYYRNLGVETIMFRELEKCKCNVVDLTDIINEKLKTFKYVKTLHGMIYDVDVYIYKDMIVKHYKTLKDINKEIIYSLSYKNGFIKNGFTGDKLNVKLT